MPSRCIPLPYLRGSFVLAWVIFFSLWWYHKSTLNRLELTHGWGRRCSQLSWFWITSEFIYTKCWGLSSDFCILHYKSCILYQTPLGVSVTILSVLLCPFFSRSKLNICNVLFTCRFFHGERERLKWKRRLSLSGHSHLCRTPRSSLDFQVLTGNWFTCWKRSRLACDINHAEEVFPFVLIQSLEQNQMTQNW